MKNKIGAVYSVLSAMLFGLTPLLAKIIYGYGYTSFLVAFLRFAIGTVVLFIVVKFHNKQKILLPKKQLLLILAVSFFYATMILLMYSAYDYIDSGLTTTLHFTYPVFVIIMAAVIMHKGLNKRHIICTVLAIAGIVFLNNSTSAVNYYGVAIAVLSGLSYAFYIVLTEKFKLDSLPVFVLSFWISLFSAFIVGAIMPFTHILPIDLNPKAIGLIILLTLTTNLFAIVLFQKGLSICGGVQASLLSTFEPLTSVVVGLTVFNENLTLNVFIGITLILSSTVILVIYKKE
ncbi:MAG: EamA family transporter [Ruminococcus sp.]|nr:EamA family transporter [Ruminococcus sp.]